MSKISIIATAYNHSKYIEGFIRKILKQDYEDYELIIIDDNSSDNTFELAKKYEDAKIHTFKNSYNKGSSLSANIGISIAKSEYISLINADDELVETYLTKSISFLESNPLIDFIAFPYKPINELGEYYINIPQIMPNFKEFARNELVKRLFYSGNVVPSPGQFFRRRVIDEVGSFNTSLLQTNDYEYNVRCVLGHKMKLFPEALVNYRMVNDGQNIDNKKPQSLFRHKVEMQIVLNSFLSINFETFNEVFSQEIKKINLLPPLPENIAFFLGIFAIESDCHIRKEWGIRTILDFIAKTDNLFVLNKKYGIEHADINKLLFSCLDENLTKDLIADQELIILKNKLKEYEDSKVFFFYKTIKALASRFK